ncbi:MAG: hypothetical protein VW274_07830, partial [Thalassolituus sp.]
DYVIKPVRDHVLLEKIRQLQKISWVYEGAQQSPESKNTVSAVPPRDLREIISVAELGYLAGLESILQRLREQGH